MVKFSLTAIRGNPFRGSVTSGFLQKWQHNIRIQLCGARCVIVITNYISAAQLVSVCGTWMQQVAQSWLIYRLTGSATLLGVVGFASQIPIFALGPIGGVLTDRYSPQRIVLWTQTAALIQAVLLASLTLTGWVQPIHIILLGIVLGIINALDMPARQSLVNQLVDIEDLPNAIGLNSSMINAARIVGPGIAGVVVAQVGEGVCFMINAISYLVVIGALLAMNISRRIAGSVPQVSLGRSSPRASTMRWRSRPYGTSCCSWVWSALWACLT